MNISKLEAPERVSELDPYNTLKKAGLKSNHILIDIGAGSGLFTIPAAEITSNTVYAVEINEEAISEIKRKVNYAGLKNIKILKISNNSYPISNDTADFILIVTVLHHIDDKDQLFSELKRVIKTGGILTIIEFHGKETPMGPGAYHRIGIEKVVNLCLAHGFKKSDYFDLGDNLYCAVFKRGDE